MLRKIMVGVECPHDSKIAFDRAVELPKGGRRPGGIEQSLLGSVASKIVEHTRVSVFVAR